MRNKNYFKLIVLLVFCSLPLVNVMAGNIFEDGFNDARDGVGDFLDDAGENIGDAFDDAGDVVGDFIDDSVGSIEDGVNDAVDSVVDFANDPVGTVDEVIKSITGDIIGELLDNFPANQITGSIDGKKHLDYAINGSTDYGYVLRVPVGEKSNSWHKDFLGNIGHKVKDIFFKDYQPFYFNVSFNCGYTGDGLTNIPTHLNVVSDMFDSSFTDPDSKWFNVFYGCYELDALTSKWDRPFGYTLEESSFSGKTVLEKPAFEDILKISKADWNYFSNYLYGVPEQYITSKNGNLNNIDYSKVSIEHEGRVEVVPGSGKYWDKITIKNLTVVSPYQDSHNYELFNPHIDGIDGYFVDQHGFPTSTDTDSHMPNSFDSLWRVLFGYSHPSKNYSENFFPVGVYGTFYMCYEKGAADLDNVGHSSREEVYKTFMFGGTCSDIPSDEVREAFMERQLVEIRDLIRRDFSHLGFDEEEVLYKKEEQIKKVLPIITNLLLD